MVYPTILVTETSAQPVAGQIAIVGRPNVGKSVLLNQIVGQKLAIVSSRPQTTRNRIVGVWNGPDAQMVFVDTPGIHRHGGALSRFMNAEAYDVLDTVDAIMLVIDAASTLAHAGRRPLSASGAVTEDERIARQMIETRKPVIVALNKVDLVKPKPQLFPLLEHWNQVGDFAALVPVSGLRNKGIPQLIQELRRHVPAGDPLFDPDMLTDRSERFLASELIREQVFQRLYDELPYSTAVQIDSWEERARGDVVINATILVERDGQKVIVVGKGGAMIRDIGTSARREVSELLGRPAHLKLFVKVATDWTESQIALRELGYTQRS